MKNKTKIIILALLILLPTLLLAGCWNYRELEEIAIVTGLAIDKIEGDKYYDTVEIINPKQRGEEAELAPVVIGIRGDSLFEGIRDLIFKAGKRLYWPHAKVVIISEEIAKDGIKPILDWVHRDGEVRSTMWVLIARNTKAGDIFNTRAELNKTISYQLDSMLKATDSVVKYIDVQLWNVIEKLAAEGVSPVIPTVTIDKFKGEKIPKIYGTAVFKNDKMVGWLNGIESRSLSWLLGKKMRGLVVLEDKDDGKKITYEFLNNRIEIKAKKQTKSSPKILINLEFEAEIAELNQLGPQFQDEQVLSQLEQELSLYITRNIEEMIYKVQKEFKSDIFGFGSIIKRQMPEYWKKINEFWEQEFPVLKTEVNVKAEIVGSALNSKPIKVRY